MAAFGETMKILDKIISKDELKKIATATFGDLVKAVVDVKRGLIGIDAELHSDLEALLIRNGSKQKDLWGINFYPGLGENDFVEFDSMINMRPSQGNVSRGVDNDEVRRKIIEIVSKWIKD